MHRLSSLALVAGTLLLGACSAGTARHSTSVVRYLYPDRQTTADTAGIPTLRLPLRLGIAFVPASVGPDRGAHATESDVPEVERVRLMGRVTDHFREQPFIKSVEVIPSAYLTPGGGFENLDRLRSMFDVDVMVLLAYDQVQFTSEGTATLAYWTILGAYVVEGEKNDTRTLMDAVVVDIPSRRVLFRAPGTSTVKAHSTPVKLQEARRVDRQKGFELASEDLVRNLDIQLGAFKEKVRNATPDEVRVVRTAEYDRRAAASAATGGGSSGLAVLACALALALMMARTRAREER